LTATLLAGSPAGMAETGATVSSSQQTEQTQPPIVPRSVQERIHLRKEQRMEQQIQENYSRKYEFYGGIGYMRFRPGANLQKVSERVWVGSLTKWYTQKWGITGEWRYSHGVSYTGPEGAYFGFFNPEVYQHTYLAGGNYRFYRRPKIGATARVAVGVMDGSFDTGSNGISSARLNSQGIGMYASATKFAMNLSVPVDFTVTPSVAIRVTPDYLLTPFSVTSQYPGNAGTQLQNSLGFNLGVVYRFWKR
jgi:hypothetical protein